MSCRAYMWGPGRSASRIRALWDCLAVCAVTHTDGWFSSIKGPLIIGGYQSYLDLPAPNLRYFSDHGDSPPTRQPSARGIRASLHYSFASTTSGWGSAIVSNLTKFHFDPMACGPSPSSLNSLLDLSRSVSGLEKLRLECLGFTAADANVSLPRFRALRSWNTEFDVPIEHFAIPNVREATFTAEMPAHPLFQAPHALPDFPQCISLLINPFPRSPTHSANRQRSTPGKLLRCRRYQSSDPSSAHIWGPHHWGDAPVPLNGFFPLYSSERGYHLSVTPPPIPICLVIACVLAFVCILVLFFFTSNPSFDVFEPHFCSSLSGRPALTSLL